MDNLTVVVPFYNGHAYLDALLASIPESLPVLLVDDFSSTPPVLGTRANTNVLRPSTKGYFTGAVNTGIRACNTDVLVLNQDVELQGTGWLELILNNRKEYALIGESIRGHHPAFPKGYVHGVFQFMRRDAIDKVGGMDSKLYPLWGASALWQWQICRAGFRSLPVYPVPGLIHHRNGSFGESISGLLATIPKTDPLRHQLIRTPPEVSVIIPCFNHGRYLSDAVNSLIGGKTSLGYMLGQTFQSFEIIIVDDASNDGVTPQIVDSLADGWKGIRVIHLDKNRGTAGAHNAGIEQAVGRLITCMSADDMREPWGLEALYEASLANPHSLVYDELQPFDRSRRHVSVWGLPPYNFEELLERNMVPVGTMFEKKAWEEVGGYPEKLRYGREDWGFAIAMGQAGYCGVKLSRAGYLYRREGQNRTLSNTTPEWRESFKRQMVELFPDLYKGKRPMGCCGGGRRAVSKGQTSVAGFSTAGGTTMPGQEGMVVLEYQGGNVGSQAWGGHSVPSGRTYLFGANSKDYRKLVDNRDVPWFLQKRKTDGSPLFVVVQMPSGQPAQPVQTAGGMPEPQTVTEAGFDPSQHTVDEVLAHAAGKDAEYIESLTQLEEAGKARKTLLAKLNEMLTGG